MSEREKLVKVNIEEEMKSAYIDYSMSVIVSRALPDEGWSETCSQESSFRDVRAWGSFKQTL